jgi:hypothetical protein
MWKKAQIPQKNNKKGQTSLHDTTDGAHTLSRSDATGHVHWPKPTSKFRHISFSNVDDILPFFEKPRKNLKNPKTHPAYKLPSFCKIVKHAGFALKLKIFSSFWKKTENQKPRKVENWCLNISTLCSHNSALLNSALSQLSPVGKAPICVNGGVGMGRLGRGLSRERAELSKGRVGVTRLSVCKI